jgi:methylated-DNA-[protein]-cysteine S-methyltransferase
MSAIGFALFETAIGACGIVWTPQGILGTQLPESTEKATRMRTRVRFPTATEGPPPPPVQRAIASIVALLAGEPSDLAGIALDMAGVPEFHRRVYAIARSIPAGKTMTYGDIAIQLGDRGLARTVGQALGKNPFAIIVPCHRVLAADGKLGGFSANGGAVTKRRMLVIEGASALDPDLFD